MSKFYIYLFNFIIGSIIGSHLLVVVQRFETENFISSTSHCDSCKIPLTLLNQIPIFSFIKYKGHCFFCKTTIPIETFYCELLGGNRIFAIKSLYWSILLFISYFHFFNQHFWLFWSIFSLINNPATNLDYNFFFSKVKLWFYRMDINYNSNFSFFINEFKK